MKRPIKPKMIAFELDIELHKEINKLKKKFGVTKRHIIETALRQYFKKGKK